MRADFDFSIDWGNAASLVGFNDRWRTYRRLMNPWLHKKAAHVFRQSQTNEAYSFLKRVFQRVGQIDSSEDLELEANRSVFYSVTYAL